MKKRILWFAGWVVMSLVSLGQDFVLNNPGMTSSPITFPGGKSSISFDFYIMEKSFSFSSLPVSPDYASISFSFSKLDPALSRPTGDGAELFNWTLVNNGGAGNDLVYTWVGTTKDVTMESSPQRKKYKIIFNDVRTTLGANRFESDIKVDANFTDPIQAKQGSQGNNHARISTYSVERECRAGMDFGDLPAKWPSARAKMLSGDCNSDGIPDGAEASVWAGAGVNMEGAQKFSDRADGDEFDDGLQLPADGIKSGIMNELKITLSSNIEGTPAYFGMWIDWNNDGNFNNDRVRSQSGFFTGTATASYNGTVVPVQFMAPDKLVSNFKIRLIVSSNPLKQNDFNAEIPNGEIEDYEISAGIMPFKFVQSDVLPNNGKLLVNWKVENQFNASAYEVEIGRTPQQFTRIADVEAFDTENEYRTEAAVDPGLRAPLLYVRIKALDKSGAIHYSRVMTVVGLHQSREPLVVSLYPNPLDQSQRVNISAKSGIFNGRYRIVVLDMKGKQMMAFERELINMKNFSIDIPLGLAAGNYQMSIINSDLKENVVVDFMKL
jgi:hypothetical protein